MRQPAFAFSGLFSLAHSGGKLFDVIEVAVYSFLRHVFSPTAEWRQPLLQPLLQLRSEMNCHVTGLEEGE